MAGTSVCRFQDSNDYQGAKMGEGASEAKDLSFEIPTAEGLHVRPD